MSSVTCCVTPIVQENENLTILDVRWNTIRDAGAQGLATALKVRNWLRSSVTDGVLVIAQDNTALTSMNLESNNIGPEGAHELAETLKVPDVFGYWWGNPGH